MDATQHREAAAQARAEAARSFEDSDTDGFLSQWASGLTAREHDAKAKLAEDGGKFDLYTLFLDGEVASTHQGWGKFGEWWRLEDAAAEKYGKRFFSPSKAKNGTERDRAKGFTYGAVKVAGYVKLTGGGNGLAGVSTVGVGVFPVVDDLRAGNYEVVATDGWRDFSDDEEA